MRSDAVKKGSQQAPHRSLFNALGFTKEEMEHLEEIEAHFRHSLSPTTLQNWQR